MRRISIKWGLLISVALIGYFLGMKALGLADNVWFRAFNAVFLFLGVYLSIKNFMDYKEGQYSYFQGIATGMFTSLVTAITFSAFLLVYLNFDTVLMSKLGELPLFRMEFTPIKAALVIFFEAMFSGYLFTYASMQFAKPSADMEQKAVHG
jgi:hypothetical protein